MIAEFLSVFRTLHCRNSEAFSSSQLFEMKRFFVKFLILLLFNLFWVSARLATDTSIIIIGGGAAGISALSELLDNDYENVKLLEASNRIGGRIHTIKDNDLVIDLGAQWIHGQVDNVVYDLVKDQKLTNVTPHEYSMGWFISSEGKKKTDYKELFDMCYEIADEGGCEKITPPQSFRDFFMKKYNQEILKGEYYEKDMRDFVKFFEKQFCVDDASDNWATSTTSTCKHYVELDGPEATNWISNGYSTVFDFITKKRPNPKEDLEVEKYITLNKEVINIDWTDGNLIKVKCQDGKVYTAKHVIVTVSLGVLKALQETMFTPSLPSDKLNSIKYLQFGTFNKIVLIFDKPFWKEEFSGVSLIWTDEGIKSITDPTLKWITDVIGFYRVFDQPRILIGWIVGTSARAIESLSENKLKEGVAKIFEKFLKPHITTTPPSKIITSKWQTNPFTRGSYSSRSPESDKYNALADTLSTPLVSSGKPVVLFAGEATHKDYYSSVHGAVESGQREARRLMNLRK